MKTLDFFVLVNDLRPADAVIVKKNPFKLLDHYLIYLGTDYNKEHVFIANYREGTRLLRQQELAEFSQDFVADRISRFKGNLNQRNAAVQRALSRKDQSSYHLLKNNCEHFSTYVQTGNAHSGQVQTFGTTLVLTGLLTAGASRTPETRAVGFFAAALGLMTLLSRE